VVYSSLGLAEMAAAAGTTVILLTRKPALGQQVASSEGP